MNELSTLESKIEQVLEQLERIRKERDSYKRKFDEREEEMRGLDAENAQLKEERNDIYNRVSSLIGKLQGIEVSSENPEPRKDLFNIE